MDNIQSLIGSAFQGLKLQDPANSERVASLLDKFDLRWTVSKQPLFLEDGTPTIYKAVVRDDNKQVFQTCKDSYSPFQNSELAELLIKIADKGGYEIHKGGYFKGGAKVYVQLLSGNQLNGIGKNKTTVVGYTTGLNSHDGSTSLKWGSTNTTICCQNTFNAVSRQLSSIVRHTPKMLDRVDAYLTEIEVAIKQEKAIFNSFVRFSEIPMERHQLVKAVKEVTGVDFTLSRQEQEEKFSTYSINKAHDLLDCIGIETAHKGETLWGLFSGVTNYTTHRMPVGNRDNARLESKYVGTGAMIDNRVFDLVSSFN